MTIIGWIRCSNWNQKQIQYKHCIIFRSNLVSWDRKQKVLSNLMQFPKLVFHAEMQLDEVSVLLFFLMRAEYIQRQMKLVLNNRYKLHPVDAQNLLSFDLAVNMIKKIRWCPNVIIGAFERPKLSFFTSILQNECTLYPRLDLKKKIQWFMHIDKSMLSMPILHFITTMQFFPLRSNVPWSCYCYFLY